MRDRLQPLADLLVQNGIWGDMKHARVVATAFFLLLTHGAWPSVADGAVGPLRSGRPAQRAHSASHKVRFRNDDPQGQRIAKKLLAKQIAGAAEDTSGTPTLRTAWVKISPSETPVLFVLYDCSPVGNCGLYGFERSNRGWRPILDSIAQTCSVLPSSHDGRRDLFASMHGSATESNVKIYWWRNSRYVRASVRERILAP